MLATETTVARQTVPAFLRYAVYVIVIVAAVVSVPRLGLYGPVPVESILDAWMVVFIAASIFRGRIETPLTLWLLAAYLLTRIVPAFYSGSPLEDFLQAHRWIFYLVVIAFAVGRTWSSVRPLVIITWVLLSMALLKAALTYLLIGPGERPGLLTENNFELALFAGLIIVLYRALGRGRIWAVAMLGAVTLLSGSRSGAIAFAILALFAILRARTTSPIIRYLLVCAVPLTVIVPLVIFDLRATGGTIDRLNFFEVFLGETASWGPLNWLFGTTPITPLSSDSCQRLSYYERLFSSAGDGTCYSVVLHSFAMRIVFDAGVFGVLVAFGVTWAMMRRARVQVSVAFALLLVALTNSMSVSGLNSAYVVLPILLAILIAPIERATDEPRYAPQDERRRAVQGRETGIGRDRAPTAPGFLANVRS